MSQTLVAFAAKGIQNYIFASNRLREIVGGSELVDKLCTSFLDDCLDKLGLKGHCTPLVQAAGWGRLLFDEANAALQFTQTWPMLCSLFAPGLQMVQVSVEVTGSLGDALRQVSEQLEVARNRPVAMLPEIGPLVERAPRTGFAAVAWRNDKKQGRRELVDAGTAAKLAVIERGAHRLIDELDPKRRIPAEGWTDDINRLAGNRDKAWIAVVHADGNGLGQLVMNLSQQTAGRSNDEVEKIYREFSSLIDTSSKGAAQDAFEKVVLRAWEQSNQKDPVGFRPIILGGDDMTAILRADLAAQYTCCYLEAFERISAERLDQFKTKHRLNLAIRRLTACAGIAYCKANYPFSSAVALSEELCKAAKKAGRDKDQPSSLMFHRIGSSLCGSWDELKLRELTGRDGLKLCCGPYRVGGVPADLVAFTDLQALANQLMKFPRGSLRGLLSTLALDRNQAADDFRRVCQVATRRNPGLAQGLQTALKQCGCNDGVVVGDATPLYEAHILREMQGLAEGQER